jgi:glucose dehydrogenase
MVVLALFVGCYTAKAQPPRDFMSDSADGRDWPSYGRTYGEHHFSPLDQINQRNVSHLKLALFAGLDVLLSKRT